MRSITTIVLLAAFTQGHGGEQPDTQIADSKDFADEFVQKLTAKLIDRLSATLEENDLDATTLGKPGVRTLPLGNVKPMAPMRPSFQGMAPSGPVVQGPSNRDLLPFRDEFQTQWPDADSRNLVAYGVPPWKRASYVPKMSKKVLVKLKKEPARRKRNEMMLKKDWTRYIMEGAPPPYIVTGLAQSPPSEEA